MKKNIFTSILFCCLLCSTLQAQRFQNVTISKDQALKDLSTLKGVLEGAHPTLFKFQSEAEWNSLIDSVKRNIEAYDSITTLEIITTWAPIIHSTGCGHTSGSPIIHISRKESKAYSKRKKKNPELGKDTTKYLPFFGNLVQNQFFIGKSVDSTLENNMELLAIDDEPIETVLNKLYKSHLSRNDGINYRFFEHLLESGYFNKYYNFLFPNKSTAKLKIKTNEKIETISVSTVIRDSLNISKGNFSYTKKDSTTVSYFKIMADEEIWEAIPIAQKNKKRKKFFEQTIALFQLKTDKKIALLKIKNFRPLHLKYYKELFQYLEEAQIEHLILDLKANHGGALLVVKDILDHLVNNSYELTLTRKKYTKDIVQKLHPPSINSFWENWHFLFNWKKKKDAIKHNYILPIKPVKEYHYNNHLYVMTDGGTFSGGSITSAFLQADQRALFFGKETGGAQDETNGSPNRVLIFPSSRIGIRIPSSFIDHQLPNSTKGSGVIPDHIILPNAEDVLNKEDNVLRAVLKYIESKKKKE